MSRPRGGGAASCGAHGEEDRPISCRPHCTVSMTGSVCFNVQLLIPDGKIHSQKDTLTGRYSLGKTRSRKDIHIHQQ